MKQVVEYKVGVYGKGTVNVIEDTLIDDGAASNSVNFLTLPDRIELIGGRRLLGSEESGNNGALGMGKITKVDGEEVIFRKIGTKLQYFNNATQLWVDIKTNLLDNEPLYFANSFTPAGRQIWMCGQDGLFKIYPSSPTSIIDLTNPLKNYKGIILIDKSRMLTVGMKEDPTGIRFSKVDKDSNYQNVSHEDLSDSATAKKNYSGTLVHGQCFGLLFISTIGTQVNISNITKAVTPVVTANGHGLVAGDKIAIAGVVGMTEINYLLARVVAVIDANSFYIDINTSSFSTYTSGGTVGKAETLTDDKNGNLIGDGSGTINYATGEYTLSFNTNTAIPVKSDYLYEDSLNGGLADFTYSATRLAGEGNVLRQDSTGSKTMFVVSFNNSYISVQDKGSWKVTIDSTDEKYDNQIYRENIACPSPRAKEVTADGVIFIDTYDSNKPKLRLLALNQLGDQLIPYDLGTNFKLEDYTFDKDTCLYKKGDWILIACKQNSPANNKIIIYNIKQKSFDVTNYTGNCFVDLYNKIIAGDSFSPNTYELFSGYDDLDYEIEAVWEGKKHNQKTDRLKKFKRFRAKGYIDPDQGFNIMASYDNDPYELIGAISGKGNYVDTQKSYLVGTSKIGEDIIGLGDSSKANYFETEIKVHTPKYERVKIAFVPTGIGYLSIMEHKFSDIRIKSAKLPKKYKRIIGTGVGYDQVGSTLVSR